MGNQGRYTARAHGTVDDGLLKPAIERLSNRADIDHSAECAAMSEIW